MLTRYCEAHLREFTPERLTDDTKAKAEIRDLFCDMAHHQWHPRSNQMAEILTRVGYDPMADIPPSELLCIDLEFPHTSEHVEEIEITDFQGVHQLSCYTEYSEGITANLISRDRQLPLGFNQKRGDKPLRERKVGSRQTRLHQN
jgi:hypothetical protein